MKITTDKYINVKLNDKRLIVEINVYEKLKDLIKKHGEFLDKIPHFEDIEDIYDLLEKLENNNIKYYSLDPQEFITIPEIYDIIITNINKETIVVLTKYNEIELIGKLPNKYKPSDVIQLFTRFIIKCDEHTIEVINEKYADYTLIFDDGTTIEINELEHQKMIEKLKNCNKIHFETLDL